MEKIRKSKTEEVTVAACFRECSEASTHMYSNYRGCFMLQAYVASVVFLEGKGGSARD